jgi:hypothetical protein
VTARRFVGVAVVTVTSVACGPTWEIQLEQTAVGTPPSFVLSRRGSEEPARIAAFRVDACEARGSPPIDTHWLTVAPRAPQPVARISYGSPPEGWRSAQGPHPLLPGCYRAAVAAAPPLEFDVLTDGRITARQQR